MFNSHLTTARSREGQESGANRRASRERGRKAARDDRLVNEFDDLAENYDRTRGGESRGEEYAAELDALMPPGEGPILEIGVGTGVVALGLARRGRQVIGLDISMPMIRRAHERLGGRVFLSDATRLALADESVAHAVSVWVVHAVADPIRLFEEAARVIRPGGRYLVATTQRAAPDDRQGMILEELTARVDEARRAPRPRRVSGEEAGEWARGVGFEVTHLERARTWFSRPAEEIEAIRLRQWPAMRELDDASLEAVTRPSLAALADLPDEPTLRRAIVDLLVLERPA